MELNTKAKALHNLNHSILPVELWQEIFPYLRVNSILNCLRSCKAFEYLYLALLSARRNYFIVGRVIKYGEPPFDERRGSQTDPYALVMDAQIGYGNIQELSTLCFAACTLILVSSDRYNAPKVVTQWNLQRVITNTYIAMGSPNIIACFTNLTNDKADQTVYELFKAEAENAAQIVLGRNFQYFKTIPLPKKYTMKTDAMVEWYKGPTLRALISQSNQFLPPLTLRQVLAKPEYIRYEGRHHIQPLCMTIAGVQEQPNPLAHPHIKCPIMPFMPWIHQLRANDPAYYTRDCSSSLTSYPTVLYRPRPGNCLVSIAVLKNTLRNHFENEIYILGLKRYIHIHLLFEIKDGKVNFVDQVFQGENCMAVATITAEKIVTYKPAEDPKLKNAFGKFVANDHCTEVFYGVVTKFDKDHVGDFFDGDVPTAYYRPNVLRERRKQTILAKEDARKERVKKSRAKKKAARKAAKEFIDEAKKLNLVK